MEITAAVLPCAAIDALANRGTPGVLAVPVTADDAVVGVDVISLLGLDHRIKTISEGRVASRGSSHSSSICA